MSDVERCEKSWRLEDDGTAGGYMTCGKLAAVKRGGMLFCEQHDPGAPPRELSREELREELGAALEAIKGICKQCQELGTSDTCTFRSIKTDKVEDCEYRRWGPRPKKGAPDAG